MPFNPLAPVVDYQSMQNRIFWFSCLVGLGAVALVRRHVPAADDLLGRLDASVGVRSIAGLPAPPGYLLPAAAIAMACRVFRLHARLSDALGIRARFDRDVIIRNFARQLAFDLSAVNLAAWHEARPQVMRQTFYAFVSGPQPRIDAQLVHQALDAWSWFWVGLEAAALAAAAAIALLLGGAWEVGLQTLGGVLAFAAAVLPGLLTQCRRLATAQVRAILDDPQRAALIRQALAAASAHAPAARAA